MKKIYQYCLLILSLVSSQVLANSAEQQPLASKSLMLDVLSLDADTLIAAGERGHIIRSSDGVNWQQQEVPTQSTITKLFFIDENIGWAVGHDSLILKTQDGGITWQLQNFKPDLQRPLFDVYFVDENQGIAVGAYGFMYRTTNGGDTWQREHHLELLNEDDQYYLEDLKQEDPEFYQEEIASILPHFNSLTMHQGVLYLAGEVGLMAKSNDFGRNWQLMDEIYIGSFFDIKATNNNVLIAAGLRGNLFYRAAEQANWQRADVDSIALLNNIVTTDTGRLFVLGNAGVILSSDDGQQFTLTTQADGKALMAGVWFKNQLVVASENGMKILDL
ncbi:WD40/YVTN/BNR-like repeat-containing protein [Thalassotalea maritima]|uniref:WD40/YVTN/BNR-like repeat-containing protein n=1 Tax=Thalassotalea maritima TaxID=3242416 RepID=UPI00352881C9